MSEIAHSYRAERQKRPPAFPRLPLLGALALIGFAAAATVFGQITDIGTVRIGTGEPAAIRDIVVERTDHTRVVVRDALSGAVLMETTQQDGGFVHGSMRALERMRLIAEVPMDEPFRIIRWQNGWVSVSDTATGQRYYLNAFGPSQVAAFEQFLPEERKAQ